MTDSARAPLPKETFEAFSTLMKYYNQLHENHVKKTRIKNPGFEPNPNNIVDEKRIAQLFNDLQYSTGIPQSAPYLALCSSKYGYVDKQFLQMWKEFIQRPEIRLIHYIRLLLIASHKPNYTAYYHLSHCDYFEAHPQPINFNIYADVLRVLQIDDLEVGRTYLNYCPDILPENMSYYFDRPQLLLEALQNKDLWAESRATVLRMIQQMPEVPQSIKDTAWEFAIGDGKTHRRDAQRVIERFPDMLPKIAGQLQSTKSSTRAIAAEWLGRLRNSETLDALQKAFEKEKIDAARVEMMKALIAFGISLEKLLDREQLLKESTAGLKKGIPKQLTWFPFAQLPALHWSDNGETVASDIVQWWLVQSVKLKSPEPSPLLSLYGETIRKSERERFAKFVLETWIAEDTRLPNQEELAGLLQSNSRWLPAPGSPFYQQHVDALRNQPVGSANDSKGLLAVVAAWGDETLPNVMEKYVRQWYGNRVHQSRALVVALGAMEQMTATQALLGISRKMKTKSIREEAENAVKKLAERKNWTLDQLADRTVPTAELDASGTLSLDLGGRQLTARWENEPKFVLYDPQGKPLKSFPGENKSDDPEKYKDAKSTYQAAGKTLKTVISQQTERLYEAMCMQRNWMPEEWSMFLREHPIVGRLCQRLVWDVYDDAGKVVAMFRPMEDGTLTDHADNAVTLTEESTGHVIRLSHSLTLPPESVAAWSEHLRDYNVKPLFAQFGMKPYHLPEEKKNTTAITDFHGVKLEAFKLRGAATKLGFVRGETGDGGWFFDYVKPFPGAELVAFIEFSGNGLPEENNVVELYQLCFRFKRQNQPIKLDNVPAVLLSEMYRSMEAMAK